MLLGSLCITYWYEIMKEEVRLKEIILAHGFNFFLKFAKKYILWKLISVINVV
jgi:hypothetical protein